MSFSDRPNLEEILHLVAKLRPRIVRIFLDLRLSDEEVKERVKAALRELAWRWNRIGDREQWLLLKLRGEAPKLSTTPEKEPEA